LEVRDGDLVVLVSDGMADNIFSYETVVIAERSYQNKTMPELAKRLSKLAVERAKKKDGLSPFGVKAK
jgi:serine/threonine protein phosphatase PrpC